MKNGFLNCVSGADSEALQVRQLWSDISVLAFLKGEVFMHH